MWDEGGPSIHGHVLTINRTQTLVIIDISVELHQSNDSQVDNSKSALQYRPFYPPSLIHTSHPCPILHPLDIVVAWSPSRCVNHGSGIIRIPLNANPPRLLQFISCSVCGFIIIKFHANSRVDSFRPLPVLSAPLRASDMIYFCHRNYSPFLFGPKLSSHGFWTQQLDVDDYVNGEG